MITEKEMTLSMLAFEFLRRVVNELEDRKFEYLEEPYRVPSEQLCADAKHHDLLYVLPELTRDFAGKIKPAFTRCHKIVAPPSLIMQYFTALDPVSGLSIRCIRHFDVMKGEFRYRFDAAFS